MRFNPAARLDSPTPSAPSGSPRGEATRRGGGSNIHAAFIGKSAINKQGVCPGGSLFSHVFKGLFQHCSTIGGYLCRRFGPEGGRRNALRTEWPWPSSAR